MKWEGMNVDRLEESYTTTDFGIAFKKGENAQLREQMNAFIAKIKENGEYDRLQEKWFGDTEPTECADPSTLTGENGTLKVGTNNEAKPFGYLAGSSTSSPVSIQRPLSELMDSFCGFLRYHPASTHPHKFCHLSLSLLLLGL